LSITYKPIGIFKSSHQETYEAPRQGVLAQNSSGVIELDQSFSPAALEDLVGFEKVWLIYDFHENESWNEKVRPPRFSEKKRSIFSTRSPYRPNSIGMSCVKLDKIKGNKLFVSDHDLLNETPVLDIKPYLPYADSFPEVKTGWVKDEAPYLVKYTDASLIKVNWLVEKTGMNFKQIIENQLAYEPTSNKAKRVKKDKDDKDGFIFAVRTWRFKFRIIEKDLEVYSVFGSYSDEDLVSKEDPHLDKETHKEFLLKFNS